jgi:hypothetical protein
MKQFTVRAFVLTLALTGIAATSVSKASTPSKAKISASPMSVPGLPVCPPHDPNACGLD